MKKVPTINERYNCFDDGKIRFSRMYSVTIKEIVPFDMIDKDTKDAWLKEVEQCSYLYDDKTDYFIKAKNNAGGEEIFVRTKKGGWFGIGYIMGCGLMDVDDTLIEKCK